MRRPKGIGIPGKKRAVFGWEEGLVEVHLLLMRLLNGFSGLRGAFVALCCNRCGRGGAGLPIGASPLGRRSAMSRFIVGSFSTEPCWQMCSSRSFHHIGASFRDEESCFGVNSRLSCGEREVEADRRVCRATSNNGLGMEWIECVSISTKGRSSDVQGLFNSLKPLIWATFALLCFKTPNVNAPGPDSLTNAFS